MPAVAKVCRHAYPPAILELVPLVGLNGKQKPTSQQLVAADEVIDMVKSYLK
jgi:hypothetical protein